MISDGRGGSKVQKREHHEKDGEDDGQAEEGPLDPASRTVGGDLAAERAAQPSAALLKEDRRHERDGQDHLGKYDGIHEGGSISAGWSGGDHLEE